MTRTYKQIQQEIEALQRQAEKLRAEETQGVIARVKTAIAHYGLTAEQLGFGAGTAGARKSAVTRAAAVPASAQGTAAKYADGQGNAWSGRGPRPRWLRDALAAGRTIEEFVSATTLVKTTSTKKKPASKRKAKLQYRDQNGNSWSGMGPRPRWLKEALAAGAPLAQFAA